MKVQEKIKTYTEDLEKVQQQLKELQQVEQRLVGAIIALQEVEKDQETAENEISVADNSDPDEY